MFKVLIVSAALAAVAYFSGKEEPKDVKMPDNVQKAADVVRPIVKEAAKSSEASSPRYRPDSGVVGSATQELERMGIGRSDKQ